MGNIEIVIKIPEEEYEFCKRQYDTECLDVLMTAVKYGTPLPKGHGRIGDLDALKQEMINGIKAGNYEDGYDNYSHINNIDDCVECVSYASTIIEADREV